MKTTVAASFMKPAEEITQADIDEIRGEAANVLICIGFLGGMACYLNVDLATALDRFRTEWFDGESDADPMEHSIKVVVFDDSFEVYDIEL